MPDWPPPERGDALAVVASGLARKQRRHAVELYRSRQRTVKEICALVGILRSTLYAYVEEFAKGDGAAGSVRGIG